MTPETEQPKTAPGPKPKTEPATKVALIRQLLGRKGGADLPALEKATGWQAHSVRAALSGLRKAGYTIERSEAKGKGSARYRITAAPDAA